jgi:hypothetical protein
MLYSTFCGPRAGIGSDEDDCYGTTNVTKLFAERNSQWSESNLKVVQTS